MDQRVVNEKLGFRFSKSTAVSENKAEHTEGFIYNNILNVSIEIKFETEKYA